MGSGDEDTAHKDDVNTRNPRSKTMDKTNFEDGYFTKRKSNAMYVPEIDLTWIILFGLAASIRLYNLSKPANVVFDEVHFGRFAAYFMKNMFFFDVHPPLGKFLIAAGGYFSGFSGNFEFNDIGEDFPIDQSEFIYYLRLVPALFSTLLVPLVYELVCDLGCSYWCAVVGGLLICFENIFVVQGKFILLDSPLLFFIALSLCSYLKFLKEYWRPFSQKWWIYLMVLGLSFTCCISIKYIGIYSVILIGGIAAFELWVLIGERTIDYITLLHHVAARFTCLIVLPVFLYLLQFYVLFEVLYKSGPSDQIMSSAFQKTLQGGLETITKNQAEVVAYGSQITLRNTHASQCWLHSHDALYPVKYPDDRGSSAQQQITCYAFKDVNNWWVVKHPDSDSLDVDFPPRFVKNGDVINLVHGTTGRGLNSHDVAAPLNPSYMEVSGYIDHNISMDSQLGWKVQLINPDSSNLWKAIGSQVRFIHVNTSASIKVTGAVLPEWGFNQYEIASDRRINTQESIFNVEEHNQNITLPSGMTEEEAKKILANKENTIPSTEMSFFEKFWEMQERMFKTNNNLMKHTFASQPLEWPFMRSGVAYWMGKDSNKQVFCIGNPMIWYTGTGMLVIYAALLLFYTLRRKRKVFDLSTDEWNAFLISGIFLLGGYLINYLPYFPAEHALFLHHYLPSLLFKIILIPVLLDHIYNVVFSDVPLAQSIFKLSCFIYVIFVIWCYKYFAPFTYGTTNLSTKEINERKWLSSWKFLSHS